MTVILFERQVFFDNLLTCTDCLTATNIYTLNI
jgi:hypothetical protein